MVPEYRLGAPLVPQLRHEANDICAVRPTIDQVADKNRNTAVRMVKFLVVTKLAAQSQKRIVAPVDVADDIVQFKHNPIYTR